MKQNNTDYHEAVDFIEFNTVGSYVGKHTPIFLNRIESY